MYVTTLGPPIRPAVRLIAATARYHSVASPGWWSSAGLVGAGAGAGQVAGAGQHRTGLVPGVWAGASGAARQLQRNPRVVPSCFADVGHDAASAPLAAAPSSGLSPTPDATTLRSTPPTCFLTVLDSPVIPCLFFLYILPSASSILHLLVVCDSAVYTPPQRCPKSRQLQRHDHDQRYLFAHYPVGSRKVDLTGNMQGPQPKAGFDVDHVLAQLRQNEKIALLSGEAPCPAIASPNLVGTSPAHAPSSLV